MPDSSQPGAPTVRVALAQMKPEPGALDANTDVALHWMARAREGGASLVVFPECALSGYVFQNRQESLEAAIPPSDRRIGRLRDYSDSLGLVVVIGFLERDERGKGLWNSALVISPGAELATYRKCHLPVLGVDRFVDAGSSLVPMDLPFGRVGILICYDLRFPEAARSLALQGAEVIIVPTNWPQGAESSPEFLTRARAWENRVYVLACNRVGLERGTLFIGRSQVVRPDGCILQQAQPRGEQLLLCEIQPSLARQKKLIIRPGEFELDPVGDRRPELYGALAQARAGYTRQQTRKSEQSQ